MKPITEHDEFLLSELLDGQLPDEQSAVLRERMSREPELARAYQSLARVDQLLVARRGVRPAFDFHRLQDAVMSDVRRRSGRRTVLCRFPLWARYGAPLAAAAAIAMAVLLNSPAPQPAGPIPGQTIPGQTIPGQTMVENTTPKTGGSADLTPAGPDSGGRMVIEFNRPGSTAQPGRITVAFARNDQQLAEHYRRFDETRRSRPAFLYARAPQETGATDDFPEASPL